MAAKTPDNMQIWTALGKTDPAHTKQFKRAGGFTGTAIKPMWSNLRMTEHFGPCGMGWGQTEPTYQVVEAGGEILVYCTVGMWYAVGEDIHTVYGVGGDKVLSQVFLKDAKGQKIIDEAKGGYKTYPQTDDEAFKKAYTDALSNAMKFIGVGADVHMGQFDDNKYVREVASEFEEAKKAEVFAEVEKQKAAHTQGGTTPMTIVTTSNVGLPPELDWAYQKASGVLICRPVEVKLAYTAAKKEYVSVKLNQAIDGKDLISYFHASHKAELLAAAGKVCKFLVVQKTSAKGAYVNLDAIMEIDGKRMVDEDPPVALTSPNASANELQARLAASNLGWTEEQLRETHTGYAAGNWAMTLEAVTDARQPKPAEIV